MRTRWLTVAVLLGFLPVRGTDFQDSGVVPLTDGGFQENGVMPITDAVHIPGEAPLPPSSASSFPYSNAPLAGGVDFVVPSAGSEGLGEHLDSDGGDLESGMFDYHKDFWPLSAMDWFSIIFSAMGLVIAAGGGIGGGGILVPLYMIFLKFRPKHAIALSNFTILGGAIANTVFNVRKQDEMGGSMIDWDIIVMMEPSTIAGAVLGSFLSKYLPDFVLTVSLSIVLAMLSYRTLDKGNKMFQKESEDEHRRLEGNLTDMEQDVGDGEQTDDDFNESAQLIGEGGGVLEDDGVVAVGRATPWGKIIMLTFCFLGCVMLTIMKGSGHGSIIGVQCGSISFWFLSMSTVPWVFMFGALFRNMLIAENLSLQGASKNEGGSIRWDAHSTIKYPLVCTIAGVFAGLFGVGGGIVKGPLMLEMGVNPSVAAATAATMILFTTSAACISFQVFGLLEPAYGVAFFFLGLICTAIGQGAINAWMRAAKRQSPPVLSIGLVMALSTLLVALEAFEKFTNLESDQLLQPASICSRGE